jgi:hypothetical protein
MNKKEAALREIRKLIDILKTWGNTLVPNLPGQEATTAQQKLQHTVNYLIQEEGLTLEGIEAEIILLDAEVAK